MKYELQLLMLMVFVGLGIKKPTWKMWVALGVLTFTWMMLNWLVLDRRVAPKV